MQLTGLLAMLLALLVAQAAPSDALDGQALQDCLQIDDVECLSSIGLEILNSLDDPETLDFKVSAAAHFAFLHARLGREGMARQAWQIGSHAHDEIVRKCETEGCYGSNFDVTIALAQRLFDSGQKIAAQNILVDRLYKDGLSGRRNRPNSDIVGGYRGLLFRQLINLGGVQPAIDYFSVAKRYVARPACLVRQCVDSLEFIQYASAFSEMGRDDLMKGAMWFAQRAPRVFRGFNDFGPTSFLLSEDEAARARLFSGPPTAQDLKMLVSFSLCEDLNRCDVAKDVYDEFAEGLERPWPSNVKFPSMMWALERYTDLIVHADDSDYFVSELVSPASMNYEECTKRPSVACVVEQIRSWSVGKECPSGYKGFGLALAAIATPVARAGEIELARSLLNEGFERETGPIIEGGDKNVVFYCEDLGLVTIPEGIISSYFLWKAERAGQRDLLLDWMQFNSDAHVREMRANASIREGIIDRYGSEETYLAINMVYMAFYAEAEDLAFQFAQEAGKASQKSESKDELSSMRTETEIAKYLLLGSQKEAFSFFGSAIKRIGGIDLEARDLMSLVRLYPQMRSLMQPSERIAFLVDISGRVSGGDDAGLAQLAVILTRLDGEVPPDPDQHVHDIVNEDYWNPASLLCPQCNRRY